MLHPSTWIYLSEFGCDVAIATCSIRRNDATDSYRGIKPCVTLHLVRRNEKRT